MHYGMIDKLWWQWQGGDRQRRLHDISGPIKPARPELEGDFSKLAAGNVTLNFEIHLGKLHRKITVNEVMDTTGTFLCYIYE